MQLKLDQTQQNERLMLIKTSIKVHEADKD